MSFLDALPERYRLILCDVWGVIHDGRRLYPGAAERLRQWQAQGRCVILVTNAPRPADAVESYLERVGMADRAWDAVASSGEAGITALEKLGRPVGFVGTGMDREILEARGIAVDESGVADHVVCTGFADKQERVEDYGDDLRAMERRGATLHCLNPDRVVVYGGALYPCAGALADAYEAIGGTVRWYGKPYPAIYQYALAQGGEPAPGEVLAIGDSIQTDMAGAHAMGFDTVFVRGGIHAEDDIAALAAEHGLSDWTPVAIVDSIG
ncbi:TIGR01459 family HAD-type hydrolase [Sphingomonas lutea]|uniref:TIGR01459 family HAD-type hydrolase n=1 Tax=Sphingomonas lutea TaxID=1045317 RepID=A0A7G9SF67_9SPHN|nr:TIGR01459 family HAD-type hydrolase [Sphingomonas lutea]QNN66492.1 TIGR01459 family HAD-type hydrolase [Sphingomonas lutea]